jgi:hypothetical protein
MGERWTSEMIAENERAMKELAHARKRLADYARAKLGLPAVDLFAQVEAAEDQVAVSSPPSASGEPALGSQDGRSALPSLTVIPLVDHSLVRPVPAVGSHR